jgi:hypothetical protein
VYPARVCGVCAACVCVCVCLRQYLAELFPKLIPLNAEPPESASRFLLFQCLLKWIVLGTAIMRGKPKIAELESELRRLRTEITEYTVKLRPMETEVCGREIVAERASRV